MILLFEREQNARRCACCTVVGLGDVTCRNIWRFFRSGEHGFARKPLSLVSVSRSFKLYPLATVANFFDDVNEDFTGRPVIIFVGSLDVIDSDDSDVQQPVRCDGDYVVGFGYEGVCLLAVRGAAYVCV